MSVRIRTVQKPNHLDRELGFLSDDQRGKVDAVLRKFIAGLQILLSLSDGEQTCCSTCALVPETVQWPGFALTAYGFLMSCRDSTPFLCSGDRQNVCSGIEMVLSAHRQPLRYLVAKTLMELRQVVPTRISGRIRMVRC